MRWKMLTSVLGCPNVLRCLRIVDVNLGCVNVSRRVHTERRTLTPTKITFAGGKPCTISMRYAFRSGSHPETYHTNALPKCPGKRIQDIHSWAKPFRQSLFAASIDVLDLLLKYVGNGSWRVAGLELGGEWMGKRILRCLFFVRFQGIIEYQLEVGGRRGRRVCVRHEGGSGGFVLQALRFFKC